MSKEIMNKVKCPHCGVENIVTSFIRSDETPQFHEHPIFACDAQVGECLADGGCEGRFVYDIVLSCKIIAHKVE